MHHRLRTRTLKICLNNMYQVFSIHHPWSPVVPTGLSLNTIGTRFSLTWLGFFSLDGAFDLSIRIKEADSSFSNRKEILAYALNWGMSIGQADAYQCCKTQDLHLNRNRSSVRTTGCMNANSNLSGR